MSSSTVCSSRDGSVVARERRCIEQDICSCIFFFTGDECGVDYVTYLLSENLKTSLWFVVLFVLILLIASWVITVHTIVKMAKNSLNHAVNMIKEHEDSFKTLQTEYYFLEDLFINMKIKPNSRIRSSFSEMKNFLGQPKRGKYVMKRCYKCILKIYSVVLFEFYKKLQGSANEASSEETEEVVRQIEDEFKTLRVFELTSLETLGKIVDLFSGGVSLTVDEEILYLSLAERIFETKEKLNVLSVDLFRSFISIIEKYERVLPRGVMDVSVVTERFDALLKLKSFRKKIPKLQAENKVIKGKRKKLLTRLFALKHEAQLRRDSIFREEHDKIKFLMAGGTFDCPDIVKLLGSDEVVIEMKDVSGIRKASSIENNYHGLFERLSVRARSKYVTLAKQRIEQRQIDIEKAVRKVHESIENNQDSEALYWIKYLTPKIDTYLLCIDTPVQYNDACLKVAHCVIDENEREQVLKFRVLFDNIF